MKFFYCKVNFVTKILFYENIENIDSELPRYTVMTAVRMGIKLATCSSSPAYPILASNEVQLIHDKEADVLHVLTLFPPPREDIPVLRGTHDHMTLGGGGGGEQNGGVEARKVEGKELLVHV